MKFKEVEIIKVSRWSGNIKYIASYHDYHLDHHEMLEKFSTCPPRKGDTLKVINKNTHEIEFLHVGHVFIDYVEDKMTVWCK